MGIIRIFCLHENKEARVPIFYIPLYTPIKKLRMLFHCLPRWHECT